MCGGVGWVGERDGPVGGGLRLGRGGVRGDRSTASAGTGECVERSREGCRAEGGGLGISRSSALAHSIECVNAVAGGRRIDAECDRSRIGRPWAMSAECSGADHRGRGRARGRRRTGRGSYVGRFRDGVEAAYRSSLRERAPSCRGALQVGDHPLQELDLPRASGRRGTAAGHKSTAVRRHATMWNASARPFIDADLGAGAGGVDALAPCGSCSSAAPSRAPQGSTHASARLGPERSALATNGASDETGAR